MIRAWDDYIFTYLCPCKFYTIGWKEILPRCTVASLIPNINYKSLILFPLFISYIYIYIYMTILLCTRTHTYIYM